MHIIVKFAYKIGQNSVYNINKGSFPYLSTPDFSFCYFIITCSCYIYTYILGLKKTDSCWIFKFSGMERKSHLTFDPCARSSSGRNLETFICIPFTPTIYTTFTRYAFTFDVIWTGYFRFLKRRIFFYRITSAIIVLKKSIYSWKKVCNINICAGKECTFIIQKHCRFSYKKIYRSIESSNSFPSPWGCLYALQRYPFLVVV